MNSTIVRLLAYFFITVLIGLIGQLETYKFDFSNMSSSVWWGILLKSMLPGLVSLKAFFDNSTHQDVEQPESAHHEEKM